MRAGSVLSLKMAVLAVAWVLSFLAAGLAAPGVALAQGAPTVTSLSPDRGLPSGGETVYINGSNLFGVTSVKFGNVEAGFTLGGGMLKAITPPGTGVQQVTVTTSAGTSATSSASEFTYSARAHITGMHVQEGPAAGGTSVVIWGYNLSATTAVKFGSADAAFVYDPNQGSLTAVSPRGSGTVQVSVITADGPSTSASSWAAEFVYKDVPVVHGVTPAAGPIAGGQTVQINGDDFTGATAVYFNANTASFTVDSNTQITATTPATNAGPVTITVENANGYGESAPGAYKFVAAPTVTSLSPATGSDVGGTVVALTGTNFVDVTGVMFGATPATSFTRQSDTRVSAVAPAGTGAANVIVTAAGGTSAATAGNLFTYGAGPSVNSVSPRQGPLTGGTSVTIRGVAFTGATAVSFGATPATAFTVNSATEILATAPAHAAGSVDVVVTTPAGVSPVAPSNDRFTYVAAPTVTGLDPDNAPSGDIKIYGTNLNGATAVTFGSTPATIVSVTPSQIIVTLPSGLDGQTVDVTVTTPGGTSATSAASRFTFTAVPIITYINASLAAPGTNISIVGLHLDSATAVRFGAIDAAIVTQTATSIIATVPAGVIGQTVDVVVVAPAGTSPTHANTKFTYLGAPTLTGLSPSSGPAGGGTTVTITGSGFMSNATVEFGGVSAASVTVDSPGQITAVTPPGYAARLVVVQTSGGSTGNVPEGIFTYVGGAAIASISPLAGPASGGTTVTITGAGFNSGSTVKFGSTTAASVNLISATTLEAVAPAGTGSVSISVTTDGYTSTHNQSFVYQGAPAPSVTNVNHWRGPIAGGTTVTITGANFTGATAVKFGAANAASFTVQSDTQITAVTPAGAEGMADVQVTTPAGTSPAGGSASFIYALKPVITMVLPASGPVAGGTSVGVYGQGLTDATSVRFGGVEATSFIVHGDGQLTATTPAGSAGPVELSVTTSAGQSDPSTVRFTYNPPMSFTTPSPLSNATVGVVYSREITAGGGQGHNSFSVTGGALPPGLALRDLMSASAALSGTPTAGGTFTFTLTATSSMGDTATQTYGLTVDAPTIAITPATLPTPTLAVPYSQTIAAAGGVAPHSFSVSAGALPAGLSLDGATGVIAGTPMTAGPFAFTISATDSATGTGPFTASQAYSGSVGVLAPIAAAAAANVAYNTATPIDLANAISGASATSVAVLTPASHGATTVNGLVVTYTPTTGYIGQDSFTYAATGPGGTSAPATVTVTVAGPTLSFTPASLPDASQAVAFSQALSVSGGAAPYSFSITSGALPSGVTLSAGGVISGTPTQSGTFDITVRVTDSSTGSGPATATRAYSLVVGAPPPATAEPTAVTVAITPGTGAGASIDLSSAVTYASGIQIVRQPTHGTLTVAGFVVTYTPTPGYFGEDSFDFVAIPLANNPRARAVAAAAAGATVTITIAPPVITVGPASLPAVNVGAAYNQAVTAAGGTAPYSFAVTAGALPTGLTLSPAGVLTGTPTTAGSYGFTVRATDSSIGTGPFSASTTYTLAVGAVPTPAPPIRVTTVQGAEVTVDLTASAVGGPFTAAALSALSPSTAGEARIVEAGSGAARRYSLTFKSAVTFAGEVEATYTLSNADGVSAPGTVIITVEARPDPSQDPDVRGLITAQTDAALRLAETQISNFGQRLEALHGDGSRRFNNGITFGFGFEDAGLNDPWMQQQRDRERLSGFWPTAPEAADEGQTVAGPGGLLRAGSASQDVGAEGQISVWTGGSIQFGRRDARSGTAKFEFTSGGLSLGADMRVNDKVAFGFGGGYGQTTTDVGDYDSRIEARDYFGVAYGSYRPVEGAFIDGLLGYGRLDFDTRRAVPVGPLAPTGATALGSRTGDQLIMSLTGGWDWQGGVLKLSPYARVSSVTGTLDAYTETGAGVANLRFGAQDIGSFKIALGARGERPFKTTRGVFTPRARFEYQRELKDGERATLGYADWGDGPMFSFTPNPFGRETLLLGLGGELRRRQSTFSLDYQGIFGEAGDYVSELVGRISLEF